MMATEAMSEEAEAIVNRIRNLFKIYLPRHTYCNEVFMFSTENETIQDPHTDVCGILKYVDILVGGVNVSYSYIISLSDECHIWEFFADGSPPNKIMIPRGNIFIFANDFVHGGMALPFVPGGKFLPGQSWHLRLHGILTVPEFRNGGENQGWVEEVFNQWRYKDGCEELYTDRY
jgi:hypothetical protein